MRRDRPRVCLVLFTTEIIRTSRGCHVTCLDYRYVEVFWYLPVLTFSETSGRSSDLNAPFVKGGGVLLHHRDRSYTRVVRSQNSYGNNTFRSAWTSVVSSKRVPHPEWQYNFSVERTSEPSEELSVSNSPGTHSESLFTRVLCTPSRAECRKGRSGLNGLTHSSPYLSRFNLKSCRHFCWTRVPKGVEKPCFSGRSSKFVSSSMRIYLSLVLSFDDNILEQWLIQKEGRKETSISPNLSTPTFRFFFFLYLIFRVQYVVLVVKGHGKLTFIGVLYLCWGQTTVYLPISLTYSLIISRNFFFPPRR